MTVGGTLAVSTNAANSLYCNNIMLNNGTITSSGGNGGEAATYGAYYIAWNRTIVANGNSNVISGNGDFGLGGSSVLTLNTPLTGDSLVASAIFKLTGSLAKTGLGTVILSGENTYTGVTTVNGGIVSLSNIGNSGVAGNLGKAASVVLGGGTLQYTGATASTNRNLTLTTATESTIDVATAATNLTISGASTATTGALIKSGPGALTLSGGNLHTGATTVRNGTLLLTGSFAATTTVQTGATLGGIGTTAGAVTVQSGGMLAPGVGATGTLAINNTLTLAGTAAMEVGRTGSVVSTDKVSGITTVTYGGDLVVTNVGGSALVGGEIFQLFSATTYTGAFSSITLPTLAPGLFWNTDNLSVNGSIRIGGPPLAGNDSYTIVKNTVGTFPVQVNDSDPDGGAVFFVGVTQGLHGTVAISGTNVIYTPASNYSGADSFTYTITDGIHGDATATVSVTISPANNAPVFIANPIAKADTVCFAAYSGSIAADASDVNWGDTLTFAKVSGPAWLGVAQNGTLSGTPTDNDCGLNSFTVSVTDNGGASATTTLQIRVTGILWTNPAGGSWTTTANWSGGVFPSGADKIADFATLNLTANAIVTLDGTRTIGHLTFGDTTPSHTWTLNTGTGGLLTLDVTSGRPRITVGNQTTTINVVLAGNDGLIKDGAGTLCLGAANTLTGPFSIEGGLVRQTVNTTFASGVALGVTNAILEIRYGYYGTNWVDVTSFTLGGGATLRAATQYAVDNGDIGFKDNITVVGTNTVHATGGGYGKHNWLSGGMTGDSAAHVNLSNGSGYGVYAEGRAIILESTYGSWTGYQGTIQAVNDVTIRGTVDLRNAKVIVAGTIGLYANGAVGQFGELTGAGTLNANGKTGGEWTIGNLGTSSTYSGVINGASTLTKTGSGTLTLSGANTYTGATIVGTGALLVNGSLSAGSSVTVNSTGTLGGTGTVGGTVTAAGNISPAGSAIGTLTTGAHTITGTLAIQVDGPGSADKLMVNGNLALTGATLSLSALGGGFSGPYVIAQCSGTLSGSFATVPAGYLVTYDTANKQVILESSANYSGWAANHGLTSLNNAGHLDPDHDGLANLAEFYLGGDPLAGGNEPPVATVDDDCLILTFTRAAGAPKDSTVIAKVQYGRSLGSWNERIIGYSTAGPDSNGTTITVEKGAAEEDPDSITIRIPKAYANGAKLFARLKVAR